MGYLLRTLFLSLLITLVTEGALAMLVPYMRPHLREVLLVNLMTNPPYVLAVLFLRILVSRTMLYLLQVPLEILIFFAEGSVYRRVLREQTGPPGHPFVFSFLANLLSVAAGLFLQAVHLPFTP